jgi:hypothetical protein
MGCCVATFSYKPIPHCLLRDNKQTNKISALFLKENSVAEMADVRKKHADTLLIT